MTGDEKKIAILKFNRHWQKMIQHNIYTLVHDYVVLVGDEVLLGCGCDQHALNQLNNRIYGICETRKENGPDESSCSIN